MTWRRSDYNFPRYCVLNFGIIRELGEKCAQSLLVFYWELGSENLGVGATVDGIFVTIVIFINLATQFWRMTPDWPLEVKLGLLGNLLFRYAKLQETACNGFQIGTYIGSFLGLSLVIYLRQGVWQRLIGASSWLKNVNLILLCLHNRQSPPAEWVGFQLLGEMSTWDNFVCLR